ncbi:alpha/beta hydrolase [Alloalcanivorax marinus]|uniref:alpha/beta hydrolase n=1 Tax=Alloalcanivorax marinus TaxID=1177169 RepID=UPI0021D1C417|nr:alpha/beta hydrolase [Alloalcanivorax marinus]MCU5786512.1 putative carboxylesterase [Alloalcanivorax marinus]
MSFDDLPDQPPIYPREAEDYAREALDRSRQAAARVRNHMDIRYGDDYWQKMDIYLPDDTTHTDLPVLLFAHGGAWTHGYKEWLGLMAPVIVETPAIFVSVSYRLAPECRYPGPLEDCIAALAWVHDHIADYGGDPDRLYVGGHSAGGHLFALAALKPHLLARAGLPANLIKGCLPLCSQLNLAFDDPAPGSGEARIYEMFLADRRDDRDASPLHNIGPNPPPFFIAHGGEDFPRIIESNRLMIAALKETGAAVRSHVEPGATHFGLALQMENPQSPVVRTLRDWLSNGPSGFDGPLH